VEGDGLRNGGTGEGKREEGRPACPEAASRAPKIQNKAGSLPLEVPDPKMKICL